MTLTEAIDYIRKVTPEDDPWTMWDIAGEDEPCHADKDIATILNAVVKGELKVSNSDTGLYRHFGEIWHVVQKEDGSVVCRSDSGRRAAADAETWKRWKEQHGWEPTNDR